MTLVGVFFRAKQRHPILPQRPGQPGEAVLKIRAAGPRGVIDVPLVIVVPWILGPAPEGVTHEGVTNAVGLEKIAERFPVVLGMKPRVWLGADVDHGVYRVCS